MVIRDNSALRVLKDDDLQSRILGSTPWIGRCNQTMVLGIHTLQDMTTSRGHVVRVAMDSHGSMGLMWETLCDVPTDFLSCLALYVPQYHGTYGVYIWYTEDT